MKTYKLLSFFLLLSLVIISCKSENDSEKQPQNKDIEIETSIKSFKGEFIHVDTAAVLKGNNFIYGVKMNEAAKEIITQVDNIKKDEYDIVNIEVTGELQPNDKEGWEEIIVIESIEKIYPPKPEAQTKVLKYSSNKNE